MSGKLFTAWPSRWAAGIMSLARRGQTLLEIGNAARLALGDAPAGTRLQSRGHDRPEGREDLQRHALQARFHVAVFVKRLA